MLPQNLSSVFLIFSKLDKFFRFINLYESDGEIFSLNCEENWLSTSRKSIWKSSKKCYEKFVLSQRKPSEVWRLWYTINNAKQENHCKSKTKKIETQKIWLNFYERK